MAKQRRQYDAGAWTAKSYSQEGKTLAPAKLPPDVRLLLINPGEHGGRKQGLDGEDHCSAPASIAADLAGNPGVSGGGKDPMRRSSPTDLVTSGADLLDARAAVKETWSEARLNSPEGIALDARGRGLRQWDRASANRRRDLDPDCHPFRLSSPLISGLTFSPGVTD